MAKWFDKIKKLWNPPDDEYDEYYEEETVRATSGGYDDREEAPRATYANNAPNRVVSINRPNAQVRSFQPISFGSEISGIADELNSKNIVVLNLERTQKEEATRILDFLSGVAYANEGKIKRTSTHTYIITPYNVGYSGSEVMDDMDYNSIRF